LEDLKGKTLRGGLAKLFAQAAGFVCRMGSLMVLARILEPQDFGLVAMVTVVTGVFALFKDAGLSMVTVQRATIGHREISTLFWINMLVGTLLALATAGLAPSLAAFYQEERLFWVTIALATGFMLNAAGVQHSAVLQREMRFAALAAVEITAQIVSVVIGIVMALRGSGYWALVAMAVTVPAVSTICVWSIGAWLPSMPRREAGLGTMIRLGGTMTLNAVVVYVAYNLDKVLLGRLWGAGALGIYGRAYQLVTIPTDNLNSAIGWVAVSALSRLQGEPERFKSYFLKGYSLVLALTLPVAIISALFADDVVLVVLGQKWTDAIPVFRLLAPTIVAFAFINPLSWFLFSTARVGRSLRMSFVIAPVVTLGYVAGLPYGPSGVALGYSVAMILLVAPMLLWALHDSMIPIRELFTVVRPQLLASVVSALVGSAVRAWCGDGFAALPRLALEAGALVISYVWILLFLTGQKAFYLDLLNELLKRRPAEATPR
jgi:O-antigen/teichoic acid export membrane protein